MDANDIGALRAENAPDPAPTLSGDESIELPEFDEPPADPVALLRRWLEDAEEAGVREPRAMALATADSNGVPSCRIVLLKDLDARGLLFTSHIGSRKGRELAGNPVATANFYWRETLQQVTVTGPVEQVSDAEADALFAERPLAAQATTTVSDQGRPLMDEAALHRAVEALIERGVPLPRPTGWSGYLIRPHRIEFWHGRASRLHRRLAYRLIGDAWTAARLQP